MISIKLTDAQVSALECRDIGFDEGCELRWAWLNSNKIGRKNLVFRNVECVVAALGKAIEYANAEDAQYELLKKTDPASARGARGACLALTNLAHKLRKEAEKHAVS